MTMMGIDLLGNSTPFVSRPSSRASRAKSAPIQNLDRFPMDMDVNKVRRFIQEKQTAYSKGKADTVIACDQSRDLQRYGKCRFDYVMTNTSGIPAQQRPVTCAGSFSRSFARISPKFRPVTRDGQPSTGPSQNGSVIHNKKVMVLNAIRTRHFSVPATENNSLSYESPRRFLDIRQTLNSAGHRLRIRASTSDTGTPRSTNGHNTSFEDVVLIPEDDSLTTEYLNTTTADEFDADEVCAPKNATKPLYRKPSVPILLQIDGPDSESDSLEIITEDRFPDRRPSSRGSMDRGNASPKPGSADNKGTGRARKKSPSSNKDGIRVDKSDNVRSSSPLSPGRLASSASKPKAKPKPGRRGSAKGTKGLSDELQTKVPLPGPHCWVDDVTVSTEPMGCEEGASEPTNSITEGQQERTNRMHSNLRMGAEENELPGFLCPSSELKSRKAATKQWLANSFFFNANRAVPLL